MPPSGDYLLRTCSHFDGHFIGHCNAAVRFVAFIKATIHHHRGSTRSDITQSDMPTPVVLDFSSRERAPVDMLAPIINRWIIFLVQSAIHPLVRPAQ
jgi:hypothetical protein